MVSLTMFGHMYGTCIFLFPTWSDQVQTNLPCVGTGARGLLRRVAESRQKRRQGDVFNNICLFICSPCITLPCTILRECIAQHPCIPRPLYTAPLPSLSPCMPLCPCTPHSLHFLHPPVCTCSPCPTTLPASSSLHVFLPMHSSLHALLASSFPACQHTPSDHYPPQLSVWWFLVGAWFICMKMSYSRSLGRGSNTQTSKSKSTNITHNNFTPLVW